MAKHSYQASTLEGLRSVFNRASPHCTPYDAHVEIKCTSSAKDVMEEILKVRTKFRARAAASGAVGVGKTFMVVAGMTAPFIGPLSLLVGSAASVLVGASAVRNNDAICFESVREKYGCDFVSNARSFKRTGDGVYSYITGPNTSAA